MVGQASSLSIRDDGQPRVLRGASHRQSKRIKKRLLCFARNDNPLPPVTEWLRRFADSTWTGLRRSSIVQP